MVRAIIAWSLQNRLIVLLGTFALIGVGMNAALNLNVEAYPDPTPPLIEIISQNPGASPEEMERLVGIPLETVLNGMPGLVDLRSTSLAGLNDIKCQFTYETDYDAARQEVRNRLATVEGLPSGVKPGLSPWSPTGEIVRYVLEGPSYTTNQLKAVQDWVLNRVLKQVQGVIDVTGYGGTVKQYQVLIDPRLLHRYGVTMQQVEDAISRSNANVGGDILTLGSQSHNVRAIGLLGGGIDPLDAEHVSDGFLLEADKLDEIGSIVLGDTTDGTPLYVRQVAKAVIGHKPRLGIVGRGVEDDVVEGIVLMRKGEKSLPTAEAVADKFREIEEEKLLPPGMSIKVFNQRTDLVHATTHNVLHNMAVGMGLVVLVLFVFLGDLGSAAVVALTIPLALMFAVSILSFRGESANLLSIGAVDFGIIVDSAVIIVENIFRFVSEGGHDRSIPLADRIVAASGEIQRPLFFSRMILICTFIPLFVMTGPAGALFGPMASTYAYAIVGALFVALMLCPVLCSFLYRGKVDEKDTIVDRLMKRAYTWTLGRLLNARLLLVVPVGVLLAATLFLASGLGGEFMPELEEGNLWIRATLPPTISRERAQAIAPRVREVIATVPEVRGVMSQVGRPDDGTDVTTFANLEFNVPLKPMEEWREGMTRVKIQDELIGKFAAFAGIEFSFSQLIRDNVQEALSGVKGANSVKVFGTDLATLEDTGQEIIEVLREVPGVENVGLFHIVGQPNFEIAIDRQACARYGINVEDVEEVVQVAIGGRAFSQMVEGEKLFDIVLRLPEELRDDPDAIARIPIDLPNSQRVPITARVPIDSAIPHNGSTARIPLSQVATIRPHKIGASAIYRENNRRYLPIKFGVRGADLASTIAEAQRRIEAAKLLPRGYRIEWSGEFAQMQEAYGRLKVFVPLSIALILVLLYTAFNSFKDTILVMVNVATATTGGILALWLTGTAFSISAAVGFISIFGVAVQAGVLLISDFNESRAAGRPVREALIEGGQRRLRPVVMTSLTAILGLMPAALATAIGTQAQKPLAIVVVGGLTFNLLLTPFLIPILYSFAPAPAPAMADVPTDDPSRSLRR